MVTENEQRTSQFEHKKRCGLAVYLKNLKNIRQLRHYGTIYYVSKKMKYVILYVDEDEKETIKTVLSKQNFVRKVWESHKPEINVDYQKEGEQ